MQTGEVAGHAAALAIQGRCDPDAIDTINLIAVLRSHGFLIDFYAQSKNTKVEQTPAK